MWSRLNIRLVIRRGLQLAFIAALIVCGLYIILPTSRIDAAANVVAFLGILSLSVPTLWINEQGRAISRIREIINNNKLKRKIIENKMERSADNDGEIKELRQQQQNLSDRIIDNLSLVEEVTDEKGAWSKWSQVCLYLGYSALFSSAVARVVLILI